MKARLSRQAARELREIAAFVRSENPSAALRVERLLRDSIDLLCSQPRSGRLLESGIRRLIVPRLPYKIYYTLDDAAPAIAVLSIRHAARTPHE